MEYKLISSYGVEQFNSDLRIAISNGWQPYMGHQSTKENGAQYAEYSILLMRSIKNN